MTSLTIVSFSSGLDSAIIKVIATSVLSEIICFPSIIRCLFLLRNSKNMEAPIRLQPSTNGGSFIKKYRKICSFFFNTRIQFSSKNILIDSCQNSIKLSILFFNTKYIRIVSILHRINQFTTFFLIQMINRSYTIRFRDGSMIIIIQ